MEVSDNKIFRCEYCRDVVMSEDIQKGGCICGSRRIRIATSITDEEKEKLEGRGYEFKDSEWVDHVTAEQERRLEREVQG